MKHEITIKVTVDATDDFGRPRPSQMVSDLIERIESLSHFRRTRYNAIEVTNVTLDGTNFLRGAYVTPDDPAMSLETALGVLTKALIETRAQQ